MSGDGDGDGALTATRRHRTPIVVHCSAGVGRSGSLVFLEHLIELFLAGDRFERTLDILATIREQRASSVQASWRPPRRRDAATRRLACLQSVQQWLYVHVTVVEYLFRRQMLGAEHVPLIKRFVADYHRAVA